MATDFKQQIDSAIWALLEANTTFTDTVKPGCRLKAYADAETRKRIQRAPTDYPQVQLEVGGGNIALNAPRTFAMNDGTFTSAVCDVPIPMTQDAILTVIYENEKASAQTPLETAIKAALFSHGTNLGINGVVFTMRERRGKVPLSNAQSAGKPFCELVMTISRRPFLSQLNFVPSTAMAIARWDVVPYQMFPSAFNVGVVAFHINGIAFVAFRVNGGASTSVSGMTLNSQTGVTEYMFTLNAADYADGPITVTAVAYPTNGVARTLETLALNANAGGTISDPVLHVKPSTGSDSNSGTEAQPFATLTRALRDTPNGATIILDEAGRYNANRYSEGGHTNVTVQRWVTVKSAAGLSRDDIVIESTDVGRQPMATRVNRIKWQSVSFDWSTFSYFAQPDQWMDNCRMFDSNGWTADYQSQGSIAPFTLFDTPETQTGPHQTFVTNSLAENMLYGWSFVTLVRNSVCRQISGAAYVMSRVVINCTVEDFNSGAGLGYHRDVFHLWGENDNIVYYGMTATQGIEAQIFNIETTTATSLNPKNQNVAFVNVDAAPLPVSNNNGGPPWSQLFGTEEHVLFMNVNLPTQRFLMDPTDNGSLWTFRATNMLFKNVGLHWWTYDTYVDTPSVVFPGIIWISCFAAS